MISLFLTSLIYSTTPTFEKDVKPIIQKRCTPCHIGHIQDLPNFLIYETAFKKKDLIKKRATIVKDMPPSNFTQMTEEERTLIRQWVDNGGKK